MYKKIKLFNTEENEEEFVYEVIPNFIYIDDIKENVYIVRTPNNDEIDYGTEEDKQMLEFANDEDDNTEVWVVDYTMSIKEWLEIANNLLVFVKNEVKK